MLKSIFDNVVDGLGRDTTNAQPAIAIFPLRAVLFPGGEMSLKIFEQRYLEMAKASLKSGEPFGICLIREGGEVGTPAVPEKFGTLAKIEDWDMPQLGVLQVRARGLKRFKILRHEVTPNGLIAATTQLIAEDRHEESNAFTVCQTFLRQIVDADVAASAEGQFDDAFWVGMRLTERLPLNNQIKQKMLELTDATIRLELIQRFLADHGLVKKS